MLGLRKIQRDSISPTSTERSLAFPSHHELNIKHHIHFDRCFKCLSVIDKPFLGPQSECVGVLHCWFPLTLELLWCPAIPILLTLRVILQNTIPQFSQPPRTHSLILSLPHRLFQNLYCHSKPLIQTPVWHFQQCLLRNGLHSIQSQSPNPHHEILGSSLRETE